MHREQIGLDDFLSDRIGMDVNGHRFIAGFRVDHPGYPEPTEYAIFEADGDFYISVASGGDPRVGRLISGSDADVTADAHHAVDDFHRVDPAAWDRRSTTLSVFDEP